MEHETTIEELNNFFSNVSYDYYNLHMAVIIAYYNHNFSPLTQKEIYNEIITKKSLKNKLRKSNGKKYSSIKIRIKDILKKKKTIFNNLNKRHRGVKYAINLSQIKSFWNSQVAIMNKEKDKNKEMEQIPNKIESKKNYSEDNINEKKEDEKSLDSIGDEKKSENQLDDSSKKLLTKKTKRKKNDKYDDEPSKNSDSIIDLTGSRTINKMEKKNYKNSFIDGFLTDEFSNNNNDIEIDFSDNNKLSDLFSNSVYDKFPKIDDNSLNQIIEKYGKLIEKLEDIRGHLIKFQNIKMAESFKEEKNNLEKEKNNIINYFNISSNLLKSKIVNQDSFNLQKELLKKSISFYLELYGDSCENHFSVLCERNEILDYLMFDKEKEINEGINDCFLNLKLFINSNKAQIKEANNCLKNYPRSYFKKKLEKIVQDLEIENTQKIQQKLNISNKINSPKKVNRKTKKKILFKTRIISTTKKSKDSCYKKKIFKGKEKQKSNSLKMPEIGNIQIPKKILINSFEKSNDNNSCDNSSLMNNSININNINCNLTDERNNNNIGNDRTSDSDNNIKINSCDENYPKNSLAYNDLRLKFSSTQSKCSDEEERGENITSEKSSEIKVNKRKKYCNDSDREKDNLSKKSRTTATFCSTSLGDGEEHNNN